MDVTTVHRRWPAPTVAAVVLVVLIGTAAAAMSYAALRDLAARNGVPEPLAVLWPVAVDGLVVAATLLVVVAPAEQFGRWLLIVSVGATIAANMVHALGYGPLGVAVAAAPPAALVAAVHALTVIARAHRTAPTDVHETTSESAHSLPTSVAGEAPTSTVTDAHELPTGRAANMPTTEPRVRTKPAPSSAPKRLVTRPAAKGTRRSRDEYMSVARAALAAAHEAGERVEVSPKWVVEVTGASRNTASKIAAELRTPVAVAVAR